MTKQQQTYEPGPGKSTSGPAFAELTREIAQRNERAHQAARKLRVVRDQEQAVRRLQQDRL
jgi:hypothetical protein